MTGTHDQKTSGQEGNGRRERGIAAYSRIFGVPEQEVPVVFAARVGSGFAEEALQAAGGAAWSHPALTGRDRSVAIITALATQGVSGDRLLTHLRLGREHGLGDDALTALMTLLAGYIGYPRASQAMETIHATTADAPARPAPPVSPTTTYTPVPEPEDT
ncbi:4-carboxymuconolactone decarboxylase [Thermocatellispora tengchongensis]|uniref:4-carboxymuconolactone decarboxylase n=1 Tax=Thermocatellispora tengchongensis TaxID=1073253 RepID=A0A840PIA4_9ACTN|nr:carboxymuconolactone decarboxylase family protein [Thermocatellispora tengchongensis]MBB5139278.1 4-carboxymuconolactone decarboxylase [Thermocatellispora tengchongensis]